MTDRLGTDLVPLFTEELRLCRVVEGETVLVLTDAQSNHAYETAILGAAQALGAHAVALTLPLGYDLQFPPLVARA